ncbi:Subtilisin-like protease SDD1 [Acorus calamus]|uniref:Subtilisin-like protease SDD1 n=1 Tax=Acorus calamus TaxID=4465 RepID=A0AAV9E9K7_ACOCL|nr:Subtilisin-like protease SDD1 [Acorus calamus]
MAATPLEFGAGHINPNRAVEPGFIYDAGIQDYIDFLCQLGYTEAQMKAITRRNHWKCSDSSSTTSLNYPSFVAIFAKGTKFPVRQSFDQTERRK